MYTDRNRKKQEKQDAQTHADADMIADVHIDSAMCCRMLQGDAVLQCDIDAETDADTDASQDRRRSTTM